MIQQKWFNIIHNNLLYNGNNFIKLCLKKVRIYLKL